MFILSLDEKRAARLFIKEHKCSIEKDEFGYKKVGAIGGEITYSFTPTGLGVIAVVSCGCGANLCLTNFDDW